MITPVDSGGPGGPFVAALAAALLAVEADAVPHAARVHARLINALRGRQSIVLEVRFTGLTCRGEAPGPVIPDVLRAASLLIVRRVQRLGFTGHATADDLSALLRCVGAAKEGTVLAALRREMPQGVYVATADGSYRPSAAAPPVAAVPPSVSVEEMENVALSNLELFGVVAVALPPVPPGEPPSDGGPNASDEAAGDLFDPFCTTEHPAGPVPPDGIAARLRTAATLTEWDRLCHSVSPEIVRLLDQGRSPEAAELVAALVWQTDRPDRARVFRESAAQSLRRAVNPESLPRLANLLFLLDRDDCRRFLRVFALLGEGTRDALAALLDRAEKVELREEVLALLLADPDGGEWLRGRFRAEQQAAAAVALLRAAVAHETLDRVRWTADGLHHSDATVRLEAAHLARGIEDPRVVRPLVQAMNSLDASLRGAAARALGSVGGAVSVPFLARAAADDPDVEVQLEAVAALGATGSGEGVPSLLGLARKRKLFGRARLARLRRAAVEALAAIDHPLALEGLRELTRERDAVVSQLALQLLKTRAEEQA